MSMPEIKSLIDSYGYMAATGNSRLTIESKDDLINAIKNIEAKHKEEIEQACEETRQQCADVFLRKTTPGNTITSGWASNTEFAIRNAVQDKGEG